MERDIGRLLQRNYDVAIIGGGVYGAFAAWDAALRGLSVALVEQTDFGGATSANSHKIIHGGLRYLQHLDFTRMRESIRERSTLLRIAPHLVRVMPCLVPTFGWGVQGRLAMEIALAVNDVIGLDRNRDLRVDRRISRGRLISKGEFLQHCPNLNRPDLTGGALYFDAQVHNPERLTLSVLQSASAAGADLANYVRVVGFLTEPTGKRVVGLKVLDLLSGNSLEVRTRLVLNCSGPWGTRLLAHLGFGGTWKIPVFKSMVLVTRKLFRSVAVGIPGRARYSDRSALLNKGYRLFFVTPWRDRSLIGTYNAPYAGDPDGFSLTEQDIATFLEQFGKAYPACGLRREDVRLAYGGLLPGSTAELDNGNIQPDKHYRILDHQREDGIGGLITVVGVKFTTARDVAEKAVDLALKILGQRHRPCRTAETPVTGGSAGGANTAGLDGPDYLEGLAPPVADHLVETYGSECARLMPYFLENPEWKQPLPQSFVTPAEVIHGVRAEMAGSLTDVIFRRTELGTAGYPGDACVKACASIMGRELGWDGARTEREILDLKRIYSRHGCNEWETLASANAS